MRVKKQRGHSIRAEAPPSAYRLSTADGKYMTSPREAIRLKTLDVRLRNWTKRQNGLTGPMLANRCAGGDRRSERRLVRGRVGDPPRGGAFNPTDPDKPFPAK